MVITTATDFTEYNFFLFFLFLAHLELPAGCGILPGMAAFWPHAFAQPLSHLYKLFLKKLAKFVHIQNHLLWTMHCPKLVGMSSQKSSLSRLDRKLLTQLYRTFTVASAPSSALTVTGSDFLQIFRFFWGQSEIQQDPRTELMLELIGSRWPALPA